MKSVPSLYRYCDGLLLPTLLESFSQTYVEAMYYKKPIFTSDLDFAHDACRDSAFYFDPHSAENIYNTISPAFSNPELISEKVRKGKERLSLFPDWHQACKMYLELLHEMSIS